MSPLYQKLTLDQPAIYQIKVPGRLEEGSTDWMEGMTIRIEIGGDGTSITTFTGTYADQAALQGILRRLYSLGIPLISVKWVEADEGSKEQ
jgi:hypothetical protein